MDIGNYIRFAAALVFVLALIGAATWLARRVGLGNRTGAVRGGNRRLQVVEVANVDAKHRAVLLRRDDVEHLVLLGGPNEFVVESGIPAPAEAGASGPAAAPKADGSR